MTDSPVPFPDEAAFLQQMGGRLDRALQDAQARVERIDRDYMDLKRYMSQNRGEIDPHEMFQNELGLRQIDDTGAFAVTVRDKLVKLKDSPYFARIDFRQDRDTRAGIFYIGRFSFHDGNRLLISDWRSPIASLFYDCETGPAGYTAPGGEMNGELIRKRQFKIKNGVMEYAIESSVNIQDDVLQRELSHTSDDKMKSIIATIQKEQNQIIRNENTGTLVIQGVAGSGKTSIALHRIAFLLYRFKDRLTAKNITIVSPNRVFGDYISGVLPELGEEPIFEVSFGDLADVQLEGVIGFEADRDPLQREDAGWSERKRFKSTLAFVRRLQEFVHRIPAIVFTPADYSYGRFTATAEMIDARFQAYEKYPVKSRLKMVVADLHDRFDTDNFMEEELPSSGTILKALNRMLKVKNTMGLYKMFYQQCGLPEMFVMPAKKTLEWADVYPFLYMHAAFEGLHESGVIKHLVVDEMQDYTPVQYAVLNLLFRCPKTILGDFGQLIHPDHQHTLHDLRQMYDEAEFVELNKSYRSTYEIITFAKGIKTTGSIDAIERHGEMPTVSGFQSGSDELAHIQNTITAFEEKPYATLGILTKTAEDAKRLHDLLTPVHNVQLITPESTRFASGISITSIQMSKGLEFDEVLIPYANSGNYTAEYDRNLLYIACTRAMHRLTLSYTGNVSPLLDTNSLKV